MKKITDKQRKFLEHTLGGPNPSRWFRNYFVTVPESPYLTDLRYLQDIGLMEITTSPDFLNPDAIVFRVTDSGKKFLEENARTDGRGTYHK